MTANEDMMIRVWEITLEEIKLTLCGHTKEVYSLDIAHEAEKIASGSADGTVRLWDINSGDMISIFKIKNGVTCVRLSSDRRFLMAGSLDQHIYLWRIGDKELIVRLKGHVDSVYDIVFSRTGNTLISAASLDKSVKVWELPRDLGRTPSGVIACKYTLNGHNDYVLCVAVSSDGRWIVSVGKDQSIRFWSAENGDHVSQLTIRAHMGPGRTEICFC